MSKTYKLALRSPKNDRQVWVLRGVPDEDYRNRSSGASLGVDPRTETALWLVDNEKGTAKAEIAAVHRELYDLHQVRDIFKDGDRIVMPRTKVRRWHSYDPLRALPQPPGSSAARLRLLALSLWLHSRVKEKTRNENPVYTRRN